MQDFPFTARFLKEIYNLAHILSCKQEACKIPMPYSCNLQDLARSCNSCTNLASSCKSVLAGYGPVPKEGHRVRDLEEIKGMGGGGGGGGGQE